MVDQIVDPIVDQIVVPQQGQRESGSTTGSTTRLTIRKMSQYKIPQDVGIADKIVGPLTLRQLIIIAVGGGVSYVLFAVAGKLYELNILEYIVIALPALISLAAAFIKINNIPFTKFVLLSLEYAIKPKKRLWNHSGISAIVAPNLVETKTEAEFATAETTKKNVNLDELSRILDSGGFENVKEVKHEDIDKVEDEDLMTQAYFGNKQKDSETENMYWRTTKYSHKERLDMLAKIPATKPKEEIKTAEQPKAKDVTEIKPAYQPPIRTETIIKPAQPAQMGNRPAGPIRTDNRMKDTAGHDRQPGQKPGQQITPEAGKKPQPAVQQGKQINVQPKKIEQRPQQPGQIKPFEKKKRHRKKKQKFAGPVRPETQIDTTQKKQPMKLMPKQFIQPPKPKIETKKTPSVPEQQETKGGIISFKELEKGDIQINLD
jgi:hypothetical protein